MLIKIRYCKHNFIHGAPLGNIQDIFYLQRKLYIMLSCFYSILLKVQNSFLRMHIPKSHFSDNLAKTTEVILF